MKKPEERPPDKYLENDVALDRWLEQQDSIGQLLGNEKESGGNMGTQHFSIVE